MLNRYSIWIGLPAFNEEKAIKKVLTKPFNFLKAWKFTDFFSETPKRQRFIRVFVILSLSKSPF